MQMYDLIMKKKRGLALSEEEIHYLVSGYTNGEIKDYQMSAFLMAVCFQGMNEQETFALTMNMRDSGRILDLSGISVESQIPRTSIPERPITMQNPAIQNPKNGNRSETYKNRTKEREER